MNDSEYIPPVRSKTQPILDRMRNPRHDDPCFVRARGGVTIYLAHGLDVVDQETPGSYVEGIDYLYSSRVLDTVKSSIVNKSKHSARWHAKRDDTAQYYEFVLQRAFDDRAIQLHHIIAGISRSQGLPYHVYGTTSDK